MQFDLGIDDFKKIKKEWADYDEKNKSSVGIYELEHQFVKV